jgi:XisH protein
MAAKDFYHEHVKTALTKDGWKIADDPYLVEWLGKKLQIDLGAERLIAAEKGTEKIAVEVKSFIGPSKIEDLEDALGQFVLYRFSLKRAAPERMLYLAIHENVYTSIFQHPDGEALLMDEGCG